MFWTSNPLSELAHSLKAARTCSCSSLSPLLENTVPKPQHAWISIWSLIMYGQAKLPTEFGKCSEPAQDILKSGKPNTVPSPVLCQPQLLSSPPHSFPSLSPSPNPGSGRRSSGSGSRWADRDGFTPTNHLVGGRHFSCPHE